MLGQDKMIGWSEEREGEDEMKEGATRVMTAGRVLGRRPIIMTQSS
jgi:hypothetical protein